MRKRRREVTQKIRFSKTCEPYGSTRMSRISRSGRTYHYGGYSKQKAATRWCVTTRLRAVFTCLVGKSASQSAVMELCRPMNTVVAPVSLLNSSKLRRRPARMNRNAFVTGAHQRSDAAPPRKLPGDSAARDSLPRVEDSNSLLNPHCG